MREMREREHIYVKGREREEKRNIEEVLQDGPCAFKLKSQSHLDLFLKRKSEGFTEALP